MEEDKIPAEVEKASEEQEKAKDLFQIQKENWYDKVPLNVKQLDTIIWAGLIALVVTFIVIALDAMDIFNPFGY